MKKISRSGLMAKLGAIRKVSNLLSPRSWRPVANQYNLICENGMAFQSYETLIAAKINGVLYLTRDHDCSNTTSKYATEWTELTTKERRDGLKSGEIVLVD